MEIKSHERSHIGIKFNSIVDLGGLKASILSSLKDYGYEKLEGRGKVSIQGILQSEVIAVKEGVNIEINYVANALNTSGIDPKLVLGRFKDLINILSQLAYELDAIVEFYEILDTIVIYSDKRPADLFEDYSNVDLSSIKKICPTATLWGMLISTKSASKYDNLLNIVAEPSPITPSKNILVKTQYRSNNKEDIIIFQKSLDENILSIIKSLNR